MLANSDSHGAPAADISIFTLLNACLRHRWLMASLAAVGCGLVLVVGLLTTRVYASASSFAPQSREIPSALSGLASQFGFALPSTNTGQSPAFYVDLLQSREILDSVLVTGLAIDSATGAPRQNLIQIYRVYGENPEIRLMRARKKLAANVIATIRQRTGVVDLTVRAPSPILAKQINALLLQLVNRFNLHTRQSQASAERVFTEQRLGEVKDDLRAAEDRLQTFLQQNRDYRNSPALTFQQDRLAREIGLQQQLFSTLAQALERAKIDEVRDTPVLTVLEQPRIPVRPESRRLALKGLAALVICLLAGLGLGLGRDALIRERRSGSAEVREFDLLTASLHPSRLLRRRASRSEDPSSA